MATRKSFYLYTEWADTFADLPAESCQILIAAIFAYASGETPEISDPIARVAFSFVRKQMDRDEEKYNAVCAKNAENVRKRWDKSADTDVSDGIPKDTNDTTVYDRIPNDTTVYDRIPTDTKNTDEEEDEDEEEDIYPPTPQGGIIAADAALSPNLPSVDSERRTITRAQNKGEADSDSGTASCKEILCLYTRLCPSLPRAMILSEKRKSAIRARQKLYSTAQFEAMFREAESSDFLRGGNRKNWTADFDWLICDANFAKTLDGNYRNRAAPPPGTYAPYGQQEDVFTRVLREEAEKCNAAR